jgi:hypothetical protein
MYPEIQLLAVEHLEAFTLQNQNRTDTKFCRKEAALDSPTFRATAVHFSDQVEIIERWLDAYIKSITKLVHDVSSLEETFNSFLLRSVPPANVSEAVLDHDYTLLAMKRFGEGSREWWSQVISGMKKMDPNVVEPIKSFMTGE